MMFCGVLKDRIQNWLRDYDSLQYLAVILIYIQIGCALIGSLGALYNGVLLINLAIALFALVAIESSSQSLGRTYAVLLFCAILLDIFWNISSERYGPFFIFSVKLTLAMQIVGFSVRLSSSLLWIQIYRLGVSYGESTAPREADFDLRHSFLSPVTPAAVRECSDSDVALGGSIYDPAYYSSLFEDGRSNRYLHVDQNSSLLDNGSASSPEVPQLKMSLNRSFQTIDSYLLPSLWRDKGIQDSKSNHDGCQS
ncbi:uncharacterized protein LOC105649623 isoform X2 [Jatropha curcas]|uniref:uncharacterized protein LOC105649623 isoform X2 n=1 Tax=Jatropha curcas TaxID=180498 RepID=UPI0018961F3E|nr:uncharacterized protein LOC105649623 isoform X2 [Jatropha curcas]